ncbi:MAG: UPF0175 family protein [Candidatus Anammoxibacter sp.]
MSITLEIPDEIVENIKMPRNQIKSDLKKELAFLLYAKEFVSMGVARRLADLTKWEFIEGLAQRRVCRHYYEKDFKEDLEYGKGSL